MKLLELLDTGPSAHTTLSRFAKELEAKGFEAEVKSNSKPGIVNRSKLCIVVKGYGLNDVIKLYKPLFGWEDKSTYFVDSKHEKKFRTVKELVDVLKDKYKRLPKCLSYVPPPVKEAVDGVTPMRQRILKFQQQLQDLDFAEVSNILRFKKEYEDPQLGAVEQLIYAFVLAPMGDDAPHAEHYKRYVVLIEDWDSMNVDGKSRNRGENLCMVTILEMHEPYAQLLKRDYSKHIYKAPVFREDECITGRQEALDNAIAYLTK